MKFLSAFLFVAIVVSCGTALADDGPTFMTPSGNIACQIQSDPSDRIYCVRRDPTQTTASVPYLSAYISLEKDKAAETGAYEGDAWYPEEAPKLAYGKSMNTRDITCTSRKAGLFCRRGKHGFSVNLKAIKVY